MPKISHSAQEIKRQMNEFVILMKVNDEETFTTSQNYFRQVLMMIKPLTGEYSIDVYDSRLAIADSTTCSYFGKSHTQALRFFNAETKKQFQDVIRKSK